MLAKCIASQCASTFFSVSSATITSKWVGEGEKLVRALFLVAQSKLPSIVFMDEIDSLLAKRADDESEGTRRVKTELLMQIDGVATNADNASQAASLLVIGATNKPKAIDEAARRRLSSRIYIPLPDAEGRKQFLQRMLTSKQNVMNEGEINVVVESTAGYSGSDLAQLCNDAARAPLRMLMQSGISITNIQLEDVPPIAAAHFAAALMRVRSSVQPCELAEYEAWDQQFGSAAYR